MAGGSGDRTCPQTNKHGAQRLANNFYDKA